jgi:hypothetical protein
VLMAFAVIVAWEKFSEAEIAVIKEAGASATLYRLATGPEPEAVTTRAALDTYLRLAIDRDWPSMEKAIWLRSEMGQSLQTRWTSLGISGRKLSESGDEFDAIKRSHRMVILSN